MAVAAINRGGRSIATKNSVLQHSLGVSGVCVAHIGPIGSVSVIRLIASGARIETGRVVLNKLLMPDANGDGTTTSGPAIGVWSAIDLEDGFTLCIALLPRRYRIVGGRCGY